jgi:diguanylate cyclase (GGDEF)-like protein/putative nucleotidyltransferase with HDIG domain
VLGCVAAASAAIIAAQTQEGWNSHGVLFAGMLALCVAGGLFEVAGPGRYALQPHLPVFVAGTALLPPAGIAALAVASFVPGAIRRGERWYLTTFNVGTWGLAGITAHFVNRIGGGGPAEDAAAVAAMFAGAIAFVALNHALVAAVAHLSRGDSPALALRSALTLGETGPLGAVVDAALALTGASLAALWNTYPAALALAAGPAGLVCASLWVPILRHKSRTDPKTGLYNFEHAQKLIEEALAAARRSGRPVSVLMADLDHLRQINNRYGHLAGDELIGAVGSVIAEAVAGRGAGARFGGEEFCVVLPELPIEAAAEVAEEIRAAVALLRLPSIADGTPSSTVSVGVAASPSHGAKADAVLHAADMALYDAKLGGRNRVRVAPPPSASSLPAEAPAPVAEEPDAIVAPVDAQPREPRATPSSDKSRRHWIAPYAGLLAAGALAVAALSDPGRILDAPWLFVALLGCMIVLDAMRLDLFERLQTSPAALVVLVLAGFFGPLGPVAGEALILVVRLVRRTSPVAALFDFGALSLAGAAAAATFMALPLHGASVIAGCAIAGIAYYIVNMPLLALVITFSRGGNPLSNFREQLAWLLPHYGAFGVLSGAFLLVHERMGWNAFLVFGVPTVVLWVAEKQYLERSRAGVEELRRSHAELQSANVNLRRLLTDNQALLSRLQHSYLSAITSLARTIEAKDPYTGGHTERVSRLASALAIELEFSPEELRAVEVGAIVHDIGKIGVPDALLLKAGPLDPDERREIEKHPEISSYILAELDVPAIVKQMVRSHHERYDGGGYPDGLAGEEIPLAARILTVADTLDAMTSDRPYRKAMPMVRALELIEENSGTQFCPIVVAALRRCLQRDARLADDDPPAGSGTASPAAVASLG